MKKQSRAQLLWIFQVYLDKLNIYDPERREAFSAMYLERKLSRATERDFSTWLQTSRLGERTQVMRTRGSRLALFAAWLNVFRPFADKEERERLTRLYNDKQLSRHIEREFHHYVKTEVHDGRELPW